MKYDRWDKRFEDAGGNEEEFEKLLKRCKWERKFLDKTALFILILLVAFVIVILAWLVPAIMHLTRGQITPSPPWLESITWTSTRPVFVVSGFTIYVAIFNLIQALNVADTRVKTLLLFRGFREANKQETGTDRSA